MLRSQRCALLLLLPLLLAVECPQMPTDPALIAKITIAHYPFNVPIDTDLDGQTDTVRVSDFDHDGRLEIVDDLQAAMDTLHDVGGKLLAIEPGTYLPPLSCPAGSACWCRLMPKFNSAGVACHTGAHDPRGHALLQIPSETTVRCVDRNTTTLATWRFDDPNGPDANYAAIGNADYSGGARHITIENCGWKGGAEAPYNSFNWALIGRRGLDFHNVEDSTIRNNNASYLYHAGIFVESSRRVTISGNVLTKDGGYGNDVIGWTSQSSIYIYNDPNAPSSSDHLITGNSVIDTGGNAISLRNDFQNAGKTMERIRIVGNLAYSHGTGTCMLMRGSRHIEIENFHCQGTQFGFQLDPSATAFGQGNSNDDVHVDGLTLVDILAPSGGSALLLAPYHSNVRFERVVVDGATLGACLVVRPPFRGVSIRDFLLRDCADHGIRFERNQTDPSIDVVGRTPDEALRLEDGEILDVDALNRRDWSASGQRSGIRFATAGARHLVLNNIRIDGVTANGIELAPGLVLEDSVFDRLDISRLAPRFRGFGPKAAHAGLACNAAAEDDWVIVTDARDIADCAFSAPSGATKTRCRCENGSWQRIQNHVPGSMIALAGSSVQRNRFENLSLHETGNETPGYSFVLANGGGAPYAQNAFTSIDIWDGLDGQTYGVQLQPGSSDATNRFTGIYCEGSAAAHCLDGVPPGSVVLP